jgi:hypothetical protein
MMILLYNDFHAGTLYAAFATLYLFVIALAALFFKPLRVTPPDPLKIMVLVYARDRAPRLDASQAALQGVNYPRERLALLVLADNCADENEEVAGGQAVTVCKCDDPAATGKGPGAQTGFSKPSRRVMRAGMFGHRGRGFAGGPGVLRRGGRQPSHASVHVVQGLNGEERLPGLGGCARPWRRHVQTCATGRSQPVGRHVRVERQCNGFPHTILQKYGCLPNRWSSAYG